MEIHDEWIDVLEPFFLLLTFLLFSPFFISLFVLSCYVTDGLLGREGGKGLVRVKSIYAAANLELGREKGRKRCLGVGRRDDGELISSRCEKTVE